MYDAANIVSWIRKRIEDSYDAILDPLSCIRSLDSKKTFAHAAN
jgi:hypothetical protein